MKTYTEISYFSNWQNEDVDNPFSYSSTQVVLWGFCKSKQVLSKTTDLTQITEYISGVFSQDSRLLVDSQCEIEQKSLTLVWTATLNSIDLTFWRQFSDAYLNLSVCLYGGDICDSYLAPLGAFKSAKLIIVDASNIHVQRNLARMWQYAKWRLSL